MSYEKVGKNEPVCIADEVPFDIPDSWEWVRISEVFQIEMGQSPKGDSVGDYKTGMEFHQGKVFFGNKYINTSNQRTISPTKIAEPNSILLCVRAPVGKVNITDRLLCIGRGLCALKPLGNIDIDYAFYMFEMYENIFVKKATGTTFIAITGEVVKNQLVPLPPLTEQHRIVDKIKEVLLLVEQYGYVYSEVNSLNVAFPEQLKKSILQEAVQGKLVPQDPNDEPASVLLERIRAEKQKLIKEGKIKKDKHESVIFSRDNSHYEKRGSEVVCIDDEISFDIPNNWEWCRLGSILTKLTDGTHSTPKYMDTGIPFISVKDISNGKLSFDDCKYISNEQHQELYSRCNPEIDDVLITKVGTTGIPVIVDTDKQFSLFVSVALLKFNNDLIFNKYIVQLVNSPLVQKQVAENTRGVGNKNWVMRDIANTLIAIPPTKEQHRIVAKLDEYFSLIDQI